MLNKELLEKYKAQNPKKYQQKFVDPIVPAPMLVTPNTLQTKEDIEKMVNEIEGNKPKRVKKEESNGDNTGVSAEHREDSKEVSA